MLCRAGTKCGWRVFFATRARTAATSGPDLPTVSGGSFPGFGSHDSLRENKVASAPRDFSSTACDSFTLPSLCFASSSLHATTATSATKLHFSGRAFSSFPRDGAHRSAQSRSNTKGTSDFIRDTVDFHDTKGTSGQTTWNLIRGGQEDGEKGKKDDEEWECDFTGGAIPNNEINGLLSNKAKLAIFNLYKDNPLAYDIPFLAKKFRIREQRVMAIIALKEIEEAAIEAGKFSRAEADSKQNSLDQQLGALYGEGIGERAYPHVSTFPKFKYVLPEEAAQDSNSGKDAVEVYRETLARKHEAIAVHEFKEHLDYNMKRVGKTLKRRKTRKLETHAGTGRATILIQPLGKESKAKGVKPWIATPEGDTRLLTEDEELLLYRQTPKPRRRTLW